MSDSGSGLDLLEETRAKEQVEKQVGHCRGPARRLDGGLAGGLAGGLDVGLAGGLDVGPAGVLDVGRAGGLDARNSDDCGHHDDPCGLVGLMVVTILVMFAVIFLC